MYFNLLNVEGAQRVQVGVSPLTKGPYGNQDSFRGFCRRLHHWTNIHLHSDPDNPE